MDVEGVRRIADDLRDQIRRVVVGQTEALDLLLLGLLCRGHVLIEGVPGTAKTLLARAFAASLGLEFKRIQFTPDLMPGDVLGSNLFDFRTNEFHLSRGPIFTQLLLADEINRTPPKTQSALLEAMQEYAVTIDGTTHALGDGFMVVATQNPLEQEGTYPLPEAQLDRFLLKVEIDYPSRDDELDIVERHGHGSGMPRVEEHGLEAVADLARLREARELVASIRLEPPIVGYIVDLVRATRGRPSLTSGASPRAANMLASASRARAAMHGRDFVIPDDVKALLRPALAHRVIVSPSAEIEGLDAPAIMERLRDEVEAPR